MYSLGNNQNMIMKKVFSKIQYFKDFSNQNIIVLKIREIQYFHLTCINGSIKKSVSDGQIFSGCAKGLLPQNK